MSNITSLNAAEELLSALGEQLQARGAVFDLVVVGGSALLVLDLMARATRDVDLVAMQTETGLVSADPLLERALAYFGVHDVDFGA